MNPPKVNDQDYINFLIATPKACTSTEAARVQPLGGPVPAHDAFTRLLHRLEPDAATLWQEAAGQVERHGGIWWSMIRRWINPTRRKSTWCNGIDRVSTRR